MIIVIKAGTPVVEIERITLEISRYGIAPEVSLGQQKAVIGLIGDTAEIDTKQIQNISPFIEQVVRIKKPFKRASLEYRNGEHSEVVVPTPNGAVTFGQNHPVVVVAGPCSVENEQMIVETAQVVKATGAQFLRGGAYKPRTSPYAFQGHGESALELLAKAREATGLGIITEVMDAAELELVASVADVIQIGARNMQNFSLLKKVGATGKPVLLKRGLAATIEDWLMSAEYILAAGNPNVILCERGIRTFDKQYTRNTLDISAIPVLRTLTHLPIMIDPSHATGKSEFVQPMAMAAIASGTDSLMIEVHPDPAKALSDGPQSLTLPAFEELMLELGALGKFFGRWAKPNNTYTSAALATQVTARV
ncbi:3-deoxy-7-phosphoheptulonate synthase [Nostoc sp. CENA67]|uniref:3-deoxy-7-phosphoheptulonate synthase n=1 Tax=Amazonocrinis nigriterrae CENA67 TaxID=2794033 RepID=A0A8J7HLQ3_9NOST|nr:3-deoxy-7-phosphoheptulonate synthase [Amazonocrinis nigriterrae]MBH8561552.1 3-deoxy-7-phosphoheptulonate synthase [Amazonocrinis nigriterrae CENA67]